jgi:hypothetical protein
MDKRVPKNCVEPARARIPYSGATVCSEKRKRDEGVLGRQQFFTEVAEWQHQQMTPGSPRLPGVPSTWDKMS